VSRRLAHEERAGYAKRLAVAFESAAIQLGAFRLQHRVGFARGSFKKHL